MTRIRCRDRRCIFNKNGICTAEEIEYEPDAGCLTMEAREDIEEEEEEEDWEEEEHAEDFEDEDEEEEEDEDWDEEDGSF
jgi:ABC-type Zn2+ transport system substrate-binding protein/surface adhesin